MFDGFNNANLEEYGYQWEDDLCITIAKHDLPHTLIAFPRLATDWDYTFRKLGFLDPTIPTERWREAIQARVREDLIHETLLRTSYSLQDQFALGGTLWLWKENANDTNANFFWGVYGPPFGDGTPQPRRWKFVDRAFPVSIAGTLESLHYDPDRASFDLRATSPEVALTDRAAATVVFLPEKVNGAVTATNASLELFDRGAAREAYVYPHGGAYEVTASGAVQFVSLRRQPSSVLPPHPLAI